MPSVDRTLWDWLIEADGAFKEIVSRPFFKGVGRLSILPIGSPTLQRKHGYKQVLDAWMKFNSASRVSWDALQEIFEAGQRDAALLYEYWCFFVLRDGMWAAFNLQEIDYGGVLKHTEDGLSITLKSGKQAAIKSRFVFRDRRYGLRYSFQRSFAVEVASRCGPYVHAAALRGSWSKRMDPDFTISIWPLESAASDLGEAAAELSGKVAHVHFDAKYRLTFAAGPGGESEDGPKRRAKGDDVDKMHAYLNAIRGSFGAFILYPGEVMEYYCETTSAVPGVGFIPARPGASGTGKEGVRAHLLTVMDSLHEWFEK